MKHLFTCMLFLCLSGIKAYTTEDIKKEYPKIFTAKVFEHNGNHYVTTGINKLPEDHYLAGFVNNNNLYIDYILTNYSSIDRQKLHDLTADTVELNIFFHNSLLTDSVFNNYFLEAVNYYLISVGKEVTDHKVQNKLKLSPDSLVAISTRFFFATRLKDEGAEWYICVGKNGYHFDKKNNMVPLIEAFCFNTIMTDLTKEEYNIVDDFQKNIKKIQNKKTDKTGDEKLEYYRQAMYKMMQKEHKLKNMLVDKYKQKKSMLNFELTIN